MQPSADLTSLVGTVDPEACRTGSYRVVTSVFKTIANGLGHPQPVKVDVWLPSQARKSQSNSPACPVIVFFHGGGLVSGHRAFTPFINLWLAPFAEKYNSIVLAPDYRLLPESTGVDILEDVEDFWTWTAGNAVGSDSLASFMSKEAPGVEVDLNRILVTGTSGGGFPALHFCLNRSLDPPHISQSVRALLLQFPVIDIDSPWFRAGHEHPQNKNKSLFNRTPPSEAEFRKIMADAKLARTNGAIVTEAGWERLPVVVAAQYYGVWYDWIVGDQEHNVDSRNDKWNVVCFDRLLRGRGVVNLPRIHLIHGMADSAVPVEHSQHFLEILKQTHPNVQVRVDIREGADHAFDDASKYEDDPILWDGLNWAAEAWLA